MFVLPCLAEAQTDSTVSANRSFIVDTIMVSGNERTKEYVILDEMSIKQGGIATPERIEYDRNRIYSLGLFTSVDILSDSLEGKRFLFVDVKERWYLIPLLMVGFRDGDPNRPYGGGGLMDYNFRGRNQRLFGTIVFGYNPSLGMGFTDPLIDRDLSLYFACNFSYSRIRNRSAFQAALTGDFDENHYDATFTLGHRYNLFEAAYFSLGFSSVSVEQYQPGRTASPSGKDAFILATLGYNFDSRDLREYPTMGSLVSGYVTKYGFGETVLSFTRIGGDLRKYVPLPMNFTLAGRAYGTFVSGSIIPTYTRAYFGYGERIRGYFKNVFEGENLVGTTVELHWPLLKAKTFTFNAIPIPQEFAVWRFGISLAAFADAGTTWLRHDAVTFNSFLSGYGGGIHFLLPYSIVMRTEYAWNDKGRGQFILDFRTSI